MAPETLEQIRLLSNYESLGEKLLQIVLCGQSELGQLLELPKLRPLRQRIALEHHLRPLAKKDAHPYLSHRLAMSGARFDDAFQPGVELLLHSAARGYPRVPNLLADRLLLAAYAKKAPGLRRVRERPAEQTRPGTVGGVEGRCSAGREPAPAAALEASRLRSSRGGAGSSDYRARDLRRASPTTRKPVTKTSAALGSGVMVASWENGATFFIGLVPVRLRIPDPFTVKRST